MLSTVRHNKRILLPEDLLPAILSFLNVDDFIKISRFSKEWHRFVNLNKKKLWAFALQSTERRLKLMNATVSAIMNSNGHLLQHYLDMGVSANAKVIGRTNIQYSWFDPTTGLMDDPSLLALAVNYTKGPSGQKIVRLLLKYGANLEERFKFNSWTTVGGYTIGPDAIHVPTTSLHVSGTTTLQRITLDNTIYAMLMLTLAEKQWVGGTIDQVIPILTSARNHDHLLTWHYVNRLMNSESCFRGYQLTLPKTTLTTIKESKNIKTWYSKNHTPSFYERHWKCMLAGALIGLYVACFAGTLSFTIGAALIGYFTTWTPPLLLSWGIGVTTTMTAGTLTGAALSSSYSVLFGRRAADLPLPDTTALTPSLEIKR